jgi:hypothetical protein
MTLSWSRAALIAVLAFLILFLLRLAFAPQGGNNFSVTFGSLADQQVLELTRKNYASAKQAPVPGQPGSDVQRFEKIATLTQQTTAFDTDKQALLDAISAQTAIIQLERATGLAGQRSLYLGIGVPPEKFDAFVEAAKAIGDNVQIEIVKNDKTNEYLQLRAQRTTLEKARTALESLSSSGGSIEERVNVQSRLTEIEQQLQTLGVSLGEFDTENELCTVKLTLVEQRAAPARSLAHRVFDALEWSALWYAVLAFGYGVAVVATWLSAGLVRYALRVLKEARQAA